ncbi:MAG: HAMP domain-containing protein [Pseudomonadota bacterium]
MEDVKYWGLSGRLALMVLAAVGITLVIFFVLTVWRLESGAIRHGKAVEELAWQRIDAQMRLQHRLVEAELAQIKQTAARQMRQLAGLQETGRVIARGNVVAIDLMAQSIAQGAQMDGVLVLDAQLNALGSHQPGLPLVKANRAFSEAGFAPLARGLIDANDRDKPRSYTDYAALGPAVLARLGSPDAARQMVLLSLHVVFDDFGDPIALLAGHRLMNRPWPAMERFAREEHLRLTVQDEGDVLVDIAPDKAIKLADASQIINGRMGMNREGDTLFRCSPFGQAWQLCITQPFMDLKVLTEQLSTHIASEKNSLILWLAALGLAGLIVAVLITAYVARRVLAPLGQITSAVRSVAKGNWLVHVAGQRRSDEVGAIARSVTVLQQSMKERERLKADMADVDELRARSSAMVAAGEKCRTQLRRELFVLSEMADAMEGDLAQLSELSNEVMGEADETMLAARRVLAAPSSGKGAARAEDVFACIDRVTGSIAAITEANHGLSRHGHAMAGRLMAVERAVEQFNQIIREDAIEQARAPRLGVEAPSLESPLREAEPKPIHNRRASDRAVGEDWSTRNLPSALLRASRLASAQIGGHGGVETSVQAKVVKNRRAGGQKIAVDPVS